MKNPEEQALQPRAENEWSYSASSFYGQFLMGHIRPTLDEDATARAAFLIVLAFSPLCSSRGGLVRSHPH